MSKIKCDKHGESNNRVGVCIPCSADNAEILNTSIPIEFWNSRRNSITDERAVILLNEFAKIDGEALKLMVMLQDARDFGDRDQLICRVHRYIEDKANKDV